MLRDGLTARHPRNTDFIHRGWRSPAITTLGRRRSSAAAQVGPEPDDCCVAVALVRFREVATIALPECARRATGAVRPNRGVGVSQNRASTRSSFRGIAGPWTCRSRRGVAGVPAGCASGEYEGSRADAAATRIGGSAVLRAELRASTVPLPVGATVARDRRDHRRSRSRNEWAVPDERHRTSCQWLPVSP
jgi:hypothetical protein